MTTTRTQRPPRDRGEGSVFYEESRSRWVALTTPQKDANGKALPRKKFTAQTKVEVLKKLREGQRALEENKPLPKARDTVGALLTDWQERGYPMTEGESGNALAKYEWAIGHLRNGLGGVKLTALSADDIEAFLEDKIDPGDGSRPLSHASISRLHWVLRVALRWGKRAKRVASNDAEDVIVPKGGSNRPSRAFTAEEITALLEAASKADEDILSSEGEFGRGGRCGKRTPLEAAWSVMLGCGLRPGECFALRWENVDLDRGKLYVRGSLVRDQKAHTLSVGPVKTAGSRRNLDIPPPVVDALRTHQRWQREAVLRAGADWDRDADLVFTNDSGGLLDPSPVRRRFKRLCVAAGMSGDRHPHELRHSCASYLSVVLGLPLEQVADVLGHSGINTLLQVYRHVNVSSSVPHALGMSAVFPVRPVAELAAGEGSTQTPSAPRG
jgi:integrase